MIEPRRSISHRQPTRAHPYFSSPRSPRIRATRSRFSVTSPDAPVVHCALSARILRRIFDIRQACASCLVHGCSHHSRCQRAHNGHSATPCPLGSTPHAPRKENEIRALSLSAWGAAATLRRKKMARTDDYARYAAECVRVALKTPNHQRQDDVARHGAKVARTCPTNVCSSSRPWWPRKYGRGLTLPPSRRSTALLSHVTGRFKQSGRAVRMTTTSSACRQVPVFLKIFLREVRAVS